MSPGVEHNSRPRVGAEAAGAAASAPGATLRPEPDAIADEHGAGAGRGSHQHRSPDAQQGPRSGLGEHSEHHHHHHHVLIEPEEDRWRWRRKIRENPRKLAVYRSLVGVAGLLLVCLGFVSGPLPGPGGIPLILAGLAIWSSEFEWAHQLMQWFKAQLARYHTWTPHWKVAFWVIFVACCLLIAYGYLAVLGAPAWLPDSVRRGFDMLPLMN